jgi:hypothetical protein
VHVRTQPGKLRPVIVGRVAAATLAVMALLALPSAAHSSLEGEGAGFHPRRLSQTRIDVSGAVATAHIRAFPDDLENALRRAGAGDSYRLVEGRGDRALLDYVAARLLLSADGVPLAAGGIVAVDEGEMWHLTMRFGALAPIRTLAFRNELLVEAFPEQRNIVRIVHPEAGTDLTWTFSRRREEYRVTFPARR